MAYIAIADFRTATVAEYCKGIELTTTEAADGLLTSAITRLSARFDEETNDHFETQTSTYNLDGQGTRKLLLPQRCQSVAAVSTIASDGTATVQASTVYRLVSSLNAAFDRRVGELDYLEVIPGQSASQVVDTVQPGGWDYYWWRGVWPEGPQTVRVTGSFGWGVTPADVKRAVALLVWEHFKPQNPHLRRATSLQTADASYTFADSQPFGIPEVDGIVALYNRPVMVPL